VSTSSCSGDKFTIIIRVDANSEIGLGHLVRCIALAEMLSHEFTIRFCCFPILPALREDIVNRGFEYIEIDSEQTWVSTLSRSYCVVLDGYHFGTELESTVRKSGALLVEVDDVFNRKFSADLVINHTPGITAHLYDASPETIFALGEEYALLRPEFLELAHSAEKKTAGRGLFICFGGADPKNLTLQVLRSLPKLSEIERVCVVTGASYLYKSELEDFIASQGLNIEYHHSLNSREMAGALRSCHVAVVPASGILLEALSAGLTVISGAYIGNQLHLLEAYEKRGLILSTGDFNSKRLTQLIGNALNSKIAAPKNAFDGKSVERIKKLFHDLNRMRFVTTRLAASHDFDLTYKWASDPLVRRYSFSKGTITREEHEKWFLRKINDPDALYLIVSCGENIVGSIRFDFVDEDAVISYQLDSDFHGRGLGLAVLRAGLIELWHHAGFRKLKRIIGYVQKENIASIRIFEKFGFNQIGKGDSILFVKEIKKDS
jgi:UDP-2,4-diacetamido-2,4,6-trideoxy-beta-L-altropyranose hydrolase